MSATATLGGLVALDMRRQPRVLGEVVERNTAALAVARGLLATARTVRIAALGSSRHAAGYGALALDAIGGVPASTLPAVGSAVPLAPSRPGDVLIAVSQSGSTPALLETVTTARTEGAMVVAVVNGEDSPLAAEADVVLHCAAGREQVVAATASVTAQMLLLRALAAEPAPDAIAALAAAVAEVLELHPVLPATPPAHVIAAGFAAEWVADEVALKFAEMVGLLPSADSLVDHLHGPAAVVTPTLALLDPGDPNAAAAVTPPHVHTVGPSPAYALATPATGDPSLDAILRVVTGQLLALHWARALGVDPDDARGLAKVTMSL